MGSAAGRVVSGYDQANGRERVASTSPLKSIMDIRPDEVPQTVLMSLYFFLIIATFWILRPLKYGMFVIHYDETALRIGGVELNAAQAEMLAKVGNMLVAFIAATAFVYLSRTLRRQRLSHVACAFSIACLLLFLPFAADPGPGMVWSFYWFGDLFNTLMLATFFAFLNDSVAPDSAKRLYGVVVLGGVVGGAFGSIVLATWIDALPLRAWIGVAIAAVVAMMIVAGVAGRRFEAAGPAATPPPDSPVPVKGSAATSGARLVFGSRYFLGIVAIVGLYEMVSTVMGFQYTSTLSFYLSGDEIASWAATMSAITNTIAFVVQVFFTSFILTRLGVGAALLFLPVAAFLGSVGFLAAPLLLLGSALNTESGFQYSINQSAREVLYTPTTTVEKYQAKAFIDMVVVRTAKAVAVAVSLAITLTFTGFENVRWLSLLTLAILAVWIRVAYFVGKDFERRTARLTVPAAAASQLGKEAATDTGYA